MTLANAARGVSVVRNHGDMHKKRVVPVLAVALFLPLAACSTNSESSSMSANSYATTSAGAASSVKSSSAYAAPSASASKALHGPSATLAATPWETTSARNQLGKQVPLTNADVQNYVGFAYFKADGTFTMYTLKNAPKMHGEWTVSPDGKTRTIVARDARGKVMFKRASQIVKLDKHVFTYRTFPDAADKSVYIDIVHTPTHHREPAH